MAASPVHNTQNDNNKDSSSVNLQLHDKKRSLQKPIKAREWRYKSLGETATLTVGNSSALVLNFFNVATGLIFLLLDLIAEHSLSDLHRSSAFLQPPLRQLI